MRFYEAFLRTWLALAASLVLAGCATAPPVQEMSDARQAVAAAREAGAAELAAEQLSEAEALLAAAGEQLKSGIFWAARRDAVNAKEIAFEALLRSRSARERDAP